MQRSYLDYAMSVIVGRALPDVRDGLKPVHRKILYAMYDSGFRPDRGYVKCARVVGDVMGNYHPHGDSSIYDALVRMGQPWSLRYPLIDGNGNFGSPGNDPPAAMRYCVTGETLVRLADDSEVRIDSLVPDAAPSSETELDLKVTGLLGDPVRATAFFHSGSHPTVRIRTTDGAELTGTRNHPVLCAVSGSAGRRYCVGCSCRGAAGRPGRRARRIVDDSGPPEGHDRPRSGRRRSAPAEVGTVEWRSRTRWWLAVVPTPGVRPVFSIRVDTDDHAFITNGFVSHNTECEARRRWPWRCCGTSTRTPSTCRTTTTAGPRSRRSCRRGSPTCWSTGPRASRSAWPPRSRRTTCARSPRPSSGASTTPRSTRPRRSRRCWRSSRAPTSRPTA